MDVTPFEILLDIREDKSGVEIGRSRANCSRSIWNASGRLVEFVDGLEGEQDQ